VLIVKRTTVAGSLKKKNIAAPILGFLTREPFQSAQRSKLSQCEIAQAASARSGDADRTD